MEYKPSSQPSPQGKGSKEIEAQYQEQQDKSFPPLPEEEGLGVRAEISKLAGSNRQIAKVLLERARELRKQQTPAEKILW
ncbi:MAG: hypothetical protein RM338_16705 [Nostoc sp. DedQUE12a]|nr:hypothetical protein [Nostoc sp. DedQUE12a]